MQKQPFSEVTDSDVIMNPPERQPQAYIYISPNQICYEGETDIVPTKKIKKFVWEDYKKNNKIYGEILLKYKRGSRNKVDCYIYFAACLFYPKIIINHKYNSGSFCHKFYFERVHFRKINFSKVFN